MGAIDPVKPVVLFDGVCNLCNGAVLFIIKRDRTSKFVFASLQSGAGQELLQKFDFPVSELSTIVLIKKDKLYTKSDAALEIVRELDGLWFLLYVLKLTPAFLRNGIYNLIANNRYRWFGKKEMCMIPTPELKKRFLS